MRSSWPIDNIRQGLNAYTPNGPIEARHRREGNSYYNLRMECVCNSGGCESVAGHSLTGTWRDVPALRCCSRHDRLRSR